MKRRISATLWVRLKRATILEPSCRRNWMDVVGLDSSTPAQAVRMSVDGDGPEEAAAEEAAAGWLVDAAGSEGPGPACSHDLSMPKHWHQDSAALLLGLRSPTMPPKKIPARGSPLHSMMFSIHTVLHCSQTGGRAPSTRGTRAGPLILAGPVYSCTQFVRAKNLGPYPVI